MKSIQSAGGPLIALDVDQLPSWSGVFGKDFIGKNSRFETDYDAVRYFAHGRHKPPRAVALLGDHSSGPILIAMPFETAIIEADHHCIYMAQVEYADHNWDFRSVSTHDFEIADFDARDRIFFSCKDCTCKLFDAAYAACDVGDDCLTFEMVAGEYVLSAAEYKPDERIGLILYKIQRA